MFLGSLQLKIYLCFSEELEIKFAYKQEYPVDFSTGYFGKIWHRPTLPRVTAVPSALVGLTSLFGMGRGGHHR